VISDYQGTVLIVSHDRDFLDRTVTVTLGLDGSGRVDIVAGGYEDWVKRRQTRPVAKATTAKPSFKPASQSGKGSKLSYKHQRDLDQLPKEIERLEAAIAADEEALHDPDLFVADPARFAALTERISRHRAEKDAAEHRWLEVAEIAEQLARGASVA
jgi:ATP-binding cassette subfamily F protein uup